MLKNLAERKPKVPRRKNCKFYDNLFRFVPGTGKQTERFISKVCEGTLYINASRYFVNYFNDENLIY